MSATPAWHNSALRPFLAELCGGSDARFRRENQEDADTSARAMGRHGRNLRQEPKRSAQQAGFHGRGSTSTSDRAISRLSRAK